MELTCKHCKHTWDYKGNSEYYATCPNCMYKVNIKGGKKMEEEIKEMGKAAEEYVDGVLQTSEEICNLTKETKPKKDKEIKETDE